MSTELVVSLRIAPGRRTLTGLSADFRVPPGISALVGPSGAGKTTLLSAVAGLLLPDAGRIALGERLLFDSEQVFHLPPERRRIGLVFQSLALFPHLSALENVAFGLPKHLPNRLQAAHAWLERMHVAHVAPRTPQTFSGGEAQRVALARALAITPEALLLDEAFTALEEPLRIRLGSEVAQIVNDLQIPCLLVTHDRHEAARLGQRTFELREGLLWT